MSNHSFRQYLLFTIAFLVLHFTGVAVMRFPYILNAIIVFTAVFCTILVFNSWFFQIPFKQTIRDIGFARASLQRLVPGVIVAALLLSIYPLLGYLLGVKINLAENWYWNLTGLFFTAGFAEEMLFRGFMFGQLRKSMNFRKAAFVSTIIFSLAYLLLFAYLSWPLALMSLLLAIGLSVPFAYLFERSGNTLWSPALVHVIIRTIGLVITTSDKSFTSLALAWIIVSFVMTHLVLLFYRDFRNLWIRN